MSNQVVVRFMRLRQINFKLLGPRVAFVTFAPIWILGVLILRLSDRVKPIQLGGINAGRLGHLVMDVEMFMAEREIECSGYRKGVIDLRYVWTAGLPISNRLILELWRPLFKFGPRCVLQPIDRWNRKLPGGRRTQVPWRKGPNILNQHNDLHGALRRTAPHLPIRNEYFELAGNILASIRPNFELNRPYVCIHIRDRSYFARLQPNNQDDGTRDADIADYELAIRYLTSRGIQVIRMGTESQDLISFKHDLVWDYACDGSRSELLDLVLPAKCRFFISTLSGPDKIAQLFRRPILFTNFAPLKSLSLWMPNSLIAPKRLRHKGGRLLTWSEIFCDDIYSLNQKQLVERDIELVANSPEEIRAAVEEMLLTGTNGHRNDPTTESHWQSLLSVIPPYLKAGGVHARIATHFLAG